MSIMLLFVPSKIELVKDPNCHCANGLVRNEDGKVGFKIFHQKYLAKFSVDYLGSVEMNSPSKWTVHRGETGHSKRLKTDTRGLNWTV